jgi:predicted RNase H-like nuclease (RuvC/YqgF family)
MPEESLEEIKTKFYRTLSWYFSEKSTPTGLYRTLGMIPAKIEELNKNLKEASESSDRLTQALSRITLWGTIIAGAGVLVALISLIFNIYKYFCSS